MGNLTTNSLNFTDAMEKGGRGESTPLYGWYDAMGNKYVSIIDTTKKNKAVRLEMIKDYGTCAKHQEEKIKSSESSEQRSLGNTRFRSLLKS